MKKNILYSLVGLAFWWINIHDLKAQSTSKDQLNIFESSDLSRYRVDIKKKAKQLANDQNILSEEQAIKTYTDALLRIESLINEGDFYINDELTTYLESMIQEIDPSNDREKGIYRVLLSKSSTPNAFCVIDGTVIVNIGLISEMENESQLAGVLAHEISHFKKQHSLKQTKVTLEEKKSGKKSSAASAYLSLKYSRESEYEADAAGLTLLASSKYNALEYNRALELVTNSKPDSISIDFITFFKTEVFSLDTSIISAKKVRQELRKSNKSENRGLFKDNDELFETHPEGEKRQLATNEILSSISYVKPSYEVNPEKFMYFKRIAQFETARNNYFDAKYLEGLHSSLKLQELFPESVDAQNLVLANLYWLCNLKSNGVISEALEDVEIRNLTSMAKLKLIFANSKSEDLGKFLFTYIKKIWEKDNSNETALYYLAAAAETHLGKEAAKIHFRSYATKYPNGKFISTVNEKLK